MNPSDSYPAIGLPPEADTRDLTRAIADQTFPPGDFSLSGSDTRSSFSQSAELPRQIGEYIIEGVIGRGGMGQVLRARHALMERPVALKILPLEAHNDASQRLRFLAEVKAIAKLIHPNIVTAFDAGSFSGSFYLAMELVAGRSLYQVVQGRGPMPAHSTLEIIYQIGEALACAHREELIHRDIKPSNIMLTDRGVVKLLDFGLARLAKQLDQFEGRRIVGTVEYMSPEQVQRSRSIDHRSDLYSLGATLFYLLTGEPMFAGEPMQVAIAHVQEDPPAIYEVRPDVDLRVDSLFQRLVAKRPDDRFSSAIDMLEYMREYGLVDGKRPIGENPKLAEEAHRPPGERIGTIPVSSFSTMRRQSSILGIDFGALRTHASYIDQENNATLLPLQSQQVALDNVIWSSPNKLLIGHEALAARAEDPGRSLYDLQRYLTLERLERRMCGELVPPQVAVAALIAAVGAAAKTANRPSKQCVLTVPGFYGHRQRLAMSDALRIAGFDCMQLLDKHLAATLAAVHRERWGISEKSTSRSNNRTAWPLPAEDVLVLSLAGYGIETSVIHCDGHEISAIAYRGSEQYGIYAWQSRLIERMLEDVGSLKVDLRRDLVVASQIQRLAESVLDQCFQRGSCQATLKIGKRKIEWQLTLQEVLEICGDFVDQLQACIDSVLSQRGASAAPLRRVVNVGPWLGASALFERLARPGPTAGVLPWLTLPPTIEQYHRIGEADVAKAAAWQSYYLLMDDPKRRFQLIGCTNSEYFLSLQSDSECERKAHVIIHANERRPCHRTAVLPRVAGSQRLNLSQCHFIEARKTPRGRVRYDELATLSLGKSAGENPQIDSASARVRIDASGLWYGSLTGITDSRREFQQSASLGMSDEQIARWQKWLDTAMLASV